MAAPKSPVHRSFGFLARLFGGLVSNPRWTLEATRMVTPAARGMRFSRKSFPVLQNGRIGQGLPARDIDRPQHQNNPLRSYFENHKEGPGIFKWIHYFDTYHRHFSKFVGRDVHVMEIGIWSGGSLHMWREYFGNNSRIIGVDIDKACLAYKTEGIEVLIGDQGDRSFWKEVRSALPRVDILIDDGSHHPEQQLVTLEEMLPHIQPGGVYMTEDIHGATNYFASYVAGLSSVLNSGTPSPFVASIDSVHLYPFVIIIEKTSQDREYFKSEMRGSEWRPPVKGW